MPVCTHMGPDMLGNREKNIIYLLRIELILIKKDDELYFKQKTIWN